jgi:hypothetical protein
VADGGGKSGKRGAEGRGEVLVGGKRKKKRKRPGSRELEGR